jgi:hypothetical protein
MNSQFQRIPSRYFWWASFRLDSDPLNRRAGIAGPCEGGSKNCGSWDLCAIYVDPGFLVEAFMLLSLPAVLVVELVVAELGRFGVNEIWSFMIAMPPLLFAWYYFVGTLIDRRKNI